MVSEIECDSVMHVKSEILSAKNFSAIKNELSFTL